MQDDTIAETHNNDIVCLTALRIGVRMRTEWLEAVIDGDANLIERLLMEGQDIDSLDRYGQTALMLAAVRGHKAVVELLLAHHAKLDVTAKYGLSALMLAIVNGYAGIAAILIEAGADTRLLGTGAPGFSGKTARDLAKEAGFNELADAIARTEG